MKIAVFTEKFPVLSETFILNQITGLLDLGHEIDIFTRKLGTYATTHGDVTKYDLLKRTHCQSIPANKIFRFVKGMGLIIDNLHKKPLPVLKSLNVLKFGKKAATLGILYAAIPFLEKRPYNYDIVHCHFGPKGSLGVLLRDIGAVEGKIITSFHGFDMSTYIKSHGNKVYNPLFLKGDLFLPICERWKQRLIELGCPEHKIIVHRMGIDVDKFQFFQRELKNDDRVQILTVARLVEKKGVQYGIEAVAKVLTRFPNVEYKIVGDGPLKDNLEHLIEHLNIGGNVKLLGWKRQEEIIELMKEADILLAPSVTGKNGDQEGIPVVLMEAMAQRLPVISTYHSGIPELVQDGESGFLVSEGNISVLAERVEYLIEHQEVRLEMGNRGRKYVEENHDIRKLNNRLVDIYRQVLN